MNPIYAAMKTTIFEETSARARASGAINLGQGFPDGSGPPGVLRAAAEALTTQSNQYPPMPGLAELRQAVAGHYARAQGVNLAPEEVIITSGATEALAASIFALVTPSDEVILLQPLYDAYLPLVERAGGIARLVRLEPPHWRITREALEAAASPRTRMVVLCNPLNPSASIAGADDLAVLARFCVERDLIALTDEVWEHVVFDNTRHQPLMACPGMRDRTVKVGSAGKIFALTGWKVGWMCAAPPLAQVLAKAHQYLAFATPPNLQWAVLHGLEHEADWIAQAAAGFQRSRDRLAAGLERLGLKALPSAGTYFLNLDLAASGIAMDDAAFCDWMLDNANVAAIPVSAFYAANPVRHLVRFCFAKQDDVLGEALARIERALPASPLSNPRGDA